MRMSSMKTMDTTKKQYHQLRSYKEPYHVQIQTQRKRLQPKAAALLQAMQTTQIQSKISGHSLKVG